MYEVTGKNNRGGGDWKTYRNTDKQAKKLIKEREKLGDTDLGMQRVRKNK